MNIPLILSLIFFINSPSKILSEEKKSIFISVNGLVCDFCAVSIEKTFNKKQAVESLNINLDKMLITIHLKDGFDLENDMIIDLINKSGYNVIDINRNK
tara:strand:+ start:3185 stop:3481 length:297 start_codon:yes stop_codon:yes gene_type:complete